MARSIKNVVMIGASGLIGQSVLRALISSETFNITVITRGITNTAFPPIVQVISIDYNSMPALVESLCGNHALIITLGADALSLQNRIIDAAIVAGIQRIIPSEFGANLDNPRTAALPIFASKVASRRYIEERIMNGARFTYTYLVTGPLLEQGIECGFFLDVKDGNPILYDMGENEFSTTAIETLGHGVVGILKHYDETTNRSVFIHDIVITQRQLLDLAIRVEPDRDWEPRYVALSDLEQRQEGDVIDNRGKAYDYNYLATFGVDYGSKMGTVDNQLLGIEGISEGKIEEIWRKAVAKRSSG